MASKTPATRKPAPKAAAAPRAVKPAAQAKPVAAPAKPETKPKKPKLVRDSFTIPKAEYAVLDELKLRAGALAHPVKKSELLRAGVKALAALGDNAFLASLHAVPAIKTGRPKLPEAIQAKTVPLPPAQPAKAPVKKAAKKAMKPASVATRKR